MLIQVDNLRTSVQGVMHKQWLLEHWKNKIKFKKNFSTASRVNEMEDDLEKRWFKNINKTRETP